MHDELGEWIKRTIEQPWRRELPRRSLYGLRVDGRAFHTWTRGLERPYSPAFMACMDATAVALCAAVSGCLLGYVQSDEISVLFSDLGSARSEPWFGGVVQKVVSVAASVATVAFAAASRERLPDHTRPAHFDARVFALPDVRAAGLYLEWRSRDASRNAISMLAEATFPSKQLHGLGTAERAALLEGIGKPVEAEPAGFRLGRLALKEEFREPVTWTHKRTGETHTAEALRTYWVARDAWPLRADDPALPALLPREPVPA